MGVGPARFVLSGLTTAPQGTTETLTVTAVDEQGATVASYTGNVTFWHPTGGINEVTPLTYTFTPADLGVHQFQVLLQNVGGDFVRVSDVDADAVWGAFQLGSISGSETVTVVAVPFSAIGMPISATEGGVFTGPVASFTVSDPTRTATDFTAAIGWGDGSTSAGAVSATTGGFTVSGSHTYVEEGSFPVNVVVQELGGSSATGNGTATVGDAPLAITFQQDVPAQQGLAFSRSLVHFSDANPAGTDSDFSASVDWGDGTAPGTGSIVACGPSCWQIGRAHV